MFLVDAREAMRIGDDSVRDAASRNHLVQITCNNSGHTELLAETAGARESIAKPVQTEVSFTSEEGAQETSESPWWRRMFGR